MVSQQEALEALKGSMRTLVRILEELLDADDPRWATFGLNMPDADTTPAAPENLAANFAASASRTEGNGSALGSRKLESNGARH